MSIIPAMMWMLYEQRIIDYEAQGMLYLENALQTWKYDGVMQTTETYKNVKYYFDRIHLENGHVQLCVNWIFKREHEQCGIT
jgi:dihydroxyacetone kinase-like predicted kinase